MNVTADKNINLKHNLKNTLLQRRLGMYNFYKYFNYFNFNRNLLYKYLHIKPYILQYLMQEFTEKQTIKSRLHTRLIPRV